MVNQPISAQLSIAATTNRSLAFLIVKELSKTAFSHDRIRCHTIFFNGKISSPFWRPLKTNLTGLLMQFMGPLNLALYQTFDKYFNLKEKPLHGKVLLVILHSGDCLPSKYCISNKRNTFKILHKICI